MTSVQQISPQRLALEMQIANLIVYRFPKQQKLNECPLEKKKPKEKQKHKNARALGKFWQTGLCGEFSLCDVILHV